MDTDADRHGNARQVLQRLLDQGDLPDTPVELVEIHVFAGGDLSFRVRQPRAEEFDLGYVPVPESR